MTQFVTSTDFLGEAAKPAIEFVAKYLAEHLVGSQIPGFGWAIAGGFLLGDLLFGYSAVGDAFAKSQSIARIEGVLRRITFDGTNSLASQVVGAVSGGIVQEDLLSTFKACGHLTALSEATFWKTNADGLRTPNIMGS